MRAALAVAPRHPQRLWWQYWLAGAVSAEDPAQAHEIAVDVEAAAAGNDERLAARAKVTQLETERVTDPDTFTGHVNEVRPAIEAALTAAGDHAGLAELYSIAAVARADQGRLDETIALSEVALKHAELGDDRNTEEVIRVGLVNFHSMGSATVDEFLAMAEHVLPTVTTRVNRTTLMTVIAFAQAMAGRASEAQAAMTEAITELRELGINVSVPFALGDSALYALWNGDPGAAEATIRITMAECEAFGSADAADYYMTGILCDSLNRQGRADEVIQLLKAREAIDHVVDPRSPVFAAIAEAEARLDLGEIDEARRVFEGIDPALPVMESPTGRSWQLLRMARLAQRLGDLTTAERLAEESASTASIKGFAVAANLANQLRSELSAASVES